MLRLFVLAFLFALPLFGKTPGPVLTVTLEKPFGYSWYDLQNSGPDTTINGAKVAPAIRSELNFPLDPFRLAIGFASFRQGGQGGQEGADTNRFLRTRLELWGAVSPAFSKMRDEDWVGSEASGNLSSSQAFIKISDTYSTVKSLLLGGGIDREFTEIHVLREPLAFGIGLGGTLFTYDIYGFSGRQLRSDNPPTWTHVDTSSSLQVGSYATYNLQSAIHFRTEESILGLHWETRIQPLIFAHSDDDHMIRKKKITMDCWGTGGAIEASLPLRQGDGEPAQVARVVPYLRTELDRTWGRMKQTYYADSPDTPADETGQSISGIKTTVNFWLIAVGIHLNFH